MERLVADFPEVPDYQCELSETLTLPGPYFNGPENVFRVRAGLQRAVSLARQIAEEYPKIPRYRAALASATHRLGWNFYASNRREHAERLFHEAVSIYGELEREFLAVDGYRFFLAMALHADGIVLRDLDRLKESREALELAIVMQSSYLETHPGIAFGESMLARLQDSLAETLMKSGEKELSTEVSEEAQEIRARMKSRFQKKANG